MTEERRNKLDGRRVGKDRRGCRESRRDSSYSGVERRVGDRRVGMSRRLAD